VDPTGAMPLFDLGALHYAVSRQLGGDVDVLTPRAQPDE